MSHANDSDYCKALVTKSRSFYNGSMFETFNTLKINALLPAKASDIAHTLKLHPQATERFLNALASVGIVERRADGTYAPVAQSPAYSSDGTRALLWLNSTKVPDLLVGSPKTAAEIEHVLRGPVGDQLALSVRMGLLTERDGRYSIAKGYEPYLISTSDKYFGPRLMHYQRVMFKMFSVDGLLGALREGKSQWGAIFGKDVTNPFDLYRQDPQLLETFMNGMHVLNGHDNAKLASKLDWSGVQTVLDVGGGSGPWTIEILKANPQLKHVDIYELNEAIPLLKSIYAKYARGELRASYVSGSFLANPRSNVLEGLAADKTYDMVSLGWILHDWNDATAAQILRKSFHHVKAGGRITLLEEIMPESRLGEATLTDVVMLLQTEGRERTFTEYKELLEGAGFKNVVMHDTPTERRVIEATK